MLPSTLPFGEDEANIKHISFTAFYADATTGTFRVGDDGVFSQHLPLENIEAHWTTAGAMSAQCAGLTLIADANMKDGESPQ